MPLFINNKIKRLDINKRVYVNTNFIKSYIFWLNKTNLESVIKYNKLV